MDSILVASWNVRGLTDPHRKYLIRNWAALVGQTIDILFIKETKMDSFKLDSALHFLYPNYPYIIALADSKKGGTVALIHLEFKIQQSGTVKLRQVA
jgi:exonuclease III